MTSLVNKPTDVVILGGGAAGLMCAIAAGKRGRRVVVLERADRAGKKILISGGGRCNFTNLHCKPENFLSANPHFAKSALARYQPKDFIALVESYGIPYHEKTKGQLFCDGSAREIVEMLLSECRKAGAEIILGASVQSIRKEDRFHVATENAAFSAASLVVATGGLSIPKIGATSFGYEVAKQFGLQVLPPRPALVPLTWAPKMLRQFGDLAGVSAEVRIGCNGVSFQDKMLFTHRGLSGPAILQVSSYCDRHQRLLIDLVPGTNLTKALVDEGGRRDLPTLRSVLRRFLPQRLADRWLDLYPPQRWTNASLEQFENQLHQWEVQPAGNEGFDKAEVTAGGVDTSELSSQTMEVKRVPGLYFIGEVVDVTGQLGGYNFQWAWASGFAAGLAA